jgi:hypothetical protein
VAAITSVAAKLGVGTAETVRKWVRRAEIEASARPGTTSEDSAELRKLRAEIRELRRAMRFSSSGRPVLCRPGDYADSRSCWWGSWPSSTGTQDLVRFIAHRRMHSACYDLTSAEYELIHYGLVQQTAGLSPPESLDVPARFTPPVPLPR